MKKLLIFGIFAVIWVGTLYPSLPINPLNAAGTIIYNTRDTNGGLREVRRTDISGFHQEYGQWFTNGYGQFKLKEGGVVLDDSFQQPIIENKKFLIFPFKQQTKQPGTLTVLPGSRFYDSVQNMEVEVKDAAQTLSYEKIVGEKILWKSIFGYGAALLGLAGVATLRGLTLKNLREARNYQHHFKKLKDEATYLLDNSFKGRAQTKKANKGKKISVGDLWELEKLKLKRGEN